MEQRITKSDVMTSEASRPIAVSDIIRIGSPVGFHRWENISVIDISCLSISPFRSVLRFKLNMSKHLEQAFPWHGTPSFSPELPDQEHFNRVVDQECNDRYDQRQSEGSSRFNGRDAGQAQDRNKKYQNQIGRNSQKKKSTRFGIPEMLPFPHDQDIE